MEFNPEYWANHRKGEKTRAEILALIACNPNLSIREISQHTGKCDRQVRRQLSQLVIENKVRREGNGYFSA
jgi:predicted ArsR family transcriptional regulator